MKEGELEGRSEMETWIKRLKATNFYIFIPETEGSTSVFNLIICLLCPIDYIKETKEHLFCGHTLKDT